MCAAVTGRPQAEDKEEPLEAKLMLEVSADDWGQHPEQWGQDSLISRSPRLGCSSGGFWELGFLAHGSCGMGDAGHGKGVWGPSESGVGNHLLFLDIRGLRDKAQFVLFHV